MQIINLLNISLFLPITFITSLTIIHYRGNRFIIYFYSYLRKIFISDKKSSIIDRYFFSLFIFIFSQFILSALHQPNFIKNNEDVYCLIVFSIIQTICFFIIGFYKNGIVNTISNFYIKTGNNFLMRALSFILFILNIFLDVIIKTLVIPTRLIINVFIGEKMHNVLLSLFMGETILLFVTIMKIALYFIQSYIFVYLSKSIYLHCTEKH
ncbi:hypothetical protein AB837_00625 [bacterium AB1]|nr:hypothetical protein AB837_00625 [bacterium AB1]